MAYRVWAMGAHVTPSRGPRSGTVIVAVLLCVASLVLLLVHLISRSGPDAAAPARAPAPAPAPTTIQPGSPTGAPASVPGPSSSPTQPPSVTLAFAGDVHFTGRTEGLLDDPGTAFGPIAEALRAADLAMVNLETAITDRGVEEPKQFHFRTSPTALDAVAAAGVDIVTMANNHAVDYGPLGLEDSLAAVARSPIPVVGVGATAAAAYAPYHVTVRGVGFSIFGVSHVDDHTFQAWTATDTTPGIASTAGRDRLLEGVRIAAVADVVVVYVHWGIEGDPCPTAEMADLAVDLAAAGADAIVGTHAHLLLGAGFQAGGAYVSYGLGNFVWWRSQAYSDDTGVLTLTVQNGAVTGAAFTPAVIDDNGRPQPVSGPQAQEKVLAFDQLRDCTTLGASP